MEVYLAARFTYWWIAREFADQIEKAGHKITWRWMNHSVVFDENDDFIPGYQPTQAEMTYMGDQDQQGVATAKVLVLLADNDDIYGALIETGMAIAYGHEVIVIAPRRTHVFWTRSLIRKVTVVSSRQQALEHLDALAAAAYTPTKPH